MTSQPAQTDWSPCPAGAISQLIQTRRRRRSRLYAARAAGVVSMLLLLSVAAFGLFDFPLAEPSQRQFHFGGISCREVRARLADFRRGNLVEELAQRMQVHLQHCPRCSRLRRQMDRDQGRIASPVYPTVGSVRFFGL